MDFIPFSWVQKIIYFDQLCQHMAESLRHPAAVDFFRLITYLGSPYAFFLIALVVSFFMLRCRMIREVLVLNIVLFLTGRLNDYLKVFFARERPKGEMLTYAAGFSFPSGHAMLATFFYGFLAYLTVKHLGGAKGKGLAFFFLLLILSIGLSRVYLNVHYMSDVIAGFIGGGVMLAIGIAVNEILVRKF
ncbi:PAP2 superfamily protein [Thermosyntropha lipolytica DSM 11003]|uniref:PAP2 superfamily protein n=1 Tax=Thermosyntropha lipolytica DSM 11003 TaxID=1123382 RepID=A0A1M5QC18_9FIRM|nr:phosphatase PAP2 family protein [Thermosyntropha lipolytica]SHH11677.1 PAP2 superfamily protein [Thermosyntropha lipolytica DSM 11003]